MSLIQVSSRNYGILESKGYHKDLSRLMDKIYRISLGVQVEPDLVLNRVHLAGFDAQMAVMIAKYLNANKNTASIPVL